MFTLNEKTTPQKVADYIIGNIQNGILQPGDSLAPEAELQQSLGVSRFSLREGLARLEALGVIESKRGQRTKISDSIDPTKLSDLFVPLSTHVHYNDFLMEARIMQESECVTLVSKRRSPEQVDGLQEIYESANGSINSPKMFAQAFERFHLELCRICQNPILETTLFFLIQNTQPIYENECASLEKRKQLVCDLKRIVEGVRNRETDSLKQFMVRHLTPKNETQEVEVPAIQTSLLA